ncbi:MAG: conjugal transfer protein TraX [Burkholderiaceae bacterium]|nr:conjugal transfer protein TraX [Burkholderiaceae bacterium]
MALDQDIGTRSQRGRCHVHLAPEVDRIGESERVTKKKKTRPARAIKAEAPGQAAGATLPRLSIDDGTIEGLKWLALLLMVLDHVNKYALHDSVPALFALGRLSMPLFAFVLGFNLARPGMLARGVGFRVLKRLSVAAVVATVPFIGLGGLGWGWWPFNVMAMLAVTVAMAQLVDQGGRGRIALAVVVFLVGGAFVEFWWPGVALGLSAWRYCRRPSWSALAVWIGALASLYLINRNWWALASLPIVFAAPHVRLAVPRVRWFFYAFYPLHLALLWAWVKLG